MSDVKLTLATLGVGSILVAGGILFYLKEQKEKKALELIEKAKTTAASIVLPGSGNANIAAALITQGSIAQTSISLVDAQATSEAAMTALIQQNWQAAYSAIRSLSLQLYDARISNERATKNNYASTIAAKRALVASLATSKAREVWWWNAGWTWKANSDGNEQLPTGGRSVKNAIWPAPNAESVKFEADYLAAVEGAKGIPAIETSMRSCDTKITQLTSMKQAFEQANGPVYAQAKASFEQAMRSGKSASSAEGASRAVVTSMI